MLKSKYIAVIFFICLLTSSFHSITLGEGITPEKIASAHRSLRENTQDGMISIPPELQPSGDDDTRVYQFQAIYQRGLTCGNHAAFNTRAIHEIVEYGRPWESPLSPKNTRQRVCTLLGNIAPADENYMLSESQVAQVVGETLAVKNVAIITHRHEQFHTLVHITEPTVYHSGIYHCGGYNDGIQELDDFFTKIRTSRSTLAHLILLHDSHWTATCILKCKDSLDIIHLNSLNTPIKEHSIQYQLTQEIIARLRS